MTDLRSDFKKRHSVIAWRNNEAEFDLGCHILEAICPINIFADVSRGRVYTMGARISSSSDSHSN